MSRLGSPEPRYDHPNALNGAAPFFGTPVWMVYIYEVPLASSGWHPEHLGTLLANLDTMPWVTLYIIFGEDRDRGPRCRSPRCRSPTTPKIILQTLSVTSSVRIPSHKSSLLSCGLQFVVWRYPVLLPAGMKTVVAVGLPPTAATVPKDGFFVSLNDYGITELGGATCFVVHLKT